MIRFMPWAVGAGELVARPVARGRTQALRRLTAPTHSPSFWLAMWAAAGVAGFVALRPALAGDGEPVPAHEVIHLLSGLSFAACGLVAWRRRPDSAVGRMLTLAAFGILVPPIVAQVDTPLALTLATLAGEMWIIGYAALILSFVSGGRLVSTVDQVLVGMFFVGLFVLQFAVMLFLEQ